MGIKIIELVLVDYVLKNEIKFIVGEVEFVYSVIKFWIVDLESSFEYLDEDIECYCLFMVKGMVKNWKVLKVFYNIYGGDVVM